MRPLARVLSGLQPTSPVRHLLGAQLSLPERARCPNLRRSSTARRKYISRLQNHIICQNNGFPRAKLGTAYRHWPCHTDRATSRAQHRGAALEHSTFRQHREFLRRQP